jgi:putative two-component system response regulator
MKTPFPHARLLVVDDEQPQLALMRTILERAGYREVRMESDPRGVAAAFVEFQPDLVMLDLHMPGMDGAMVLKQLRGLISAETYLPIVMISGDLTLESRREVLDLGAKDFVTKPFDVHEVLLRLRNMLETRSLHAELQNHSQQLEAAVRIRTRELSESRIEIVHRLAVCAEFRDDVTGTHTRRVGALAAAVASALGAYPRTVDVLEQAAQLHDIGKIGIPDAILRKAGPLTDEEFEIMKTHTVIGARILAHGRSALLRMAERIALSHHERWDGTGYPHRLAGEGIPLLARIVAVADVADALGQERPYREAWSETRVRAYITEQRGRLFDPRVADTFLRLDWQPATNGRPAARGGSRFPASGSSYLFRSRARDPGKRLHLGA